MPTDCRPPDTATVEDLRRYQLHLVDHGISPVSLNAAITGLKFFFDVTLDHADLMAKMQTVRIPRTLPIILSRDEVGALFAARPRKNTSTFRLRQSAPHWPGPIRDGVALR